MGTTRISQPLAGSQGWQIAIDAWRGAIQQTVYAVCVNAPLSPGATPSNGHIGGADVLSQGCPSGQQIVGGGYSSQPAPYASALGEGATDSLDPSKWWLSVYYQSTGGTLGNGQMTDIAVCAQINPTAAR
jgi:hypothetical protein